MRRHLTYANVAATLALVFAMSGGALAANHYLVESTKEINPKVLKKLHGAVGKAGKTGGTGAPGPTGPAGTPGAGGPPGSRGLEGPRGSEGPQGPSAAFSTYHDGAITLATFDNEYQPVLSLKELPAGDYWIVATLQATNEFEVEITVQCRLAAEGDNDVRDFDLFDETNETETGVMQVVNGFPEDGGSATVECDDFMDPTAITISHIKITALQVGELANTPG